MCASCCKRLHSDAPTAPAPVKPADNQVGQNSVSDHLCLQQRPSDAEHSSPPHQQRVCLLLQRLHSNAPTAPVPATAAFCCNALLTNASSAMCASCCSACTSQGSRPSYRAEVTERAAVPVITSFHYSCKLFYYKARPRPYLAQNDVFWARRLLQT